MTVNRPSPSFASTKQMDISPDGQTYAQRYDVNSYPHVAIIDPRTGRLVWKKEGWTQENPLTSEQFAEHAADFCSRHSFDRPPVAPRAASAPSAATSANGTSGAAKKRPMQELTEEEQLQAAIQASMQRDEEDDMMNEEDDDSYDDADASQDGTNGKMESKDVDAEMKQEGEGENPQTFEDKLLVTEVGSEPVSGEMGKVQIRMPDGKRLVRTFRLSDTVMVIFAFVAQSNDDAKGGKAFELKAGFPPRDLRPNVDETISSCGLAGEAITARWK